MNWKNSESAAPTTATAIPPLRPTRPHPAIIAKPPQRAQLRRFICQLIVTAALLIPKSHACGPDFPNNLLTSGDAALLAAPTASFERELKRLHLAPSRFGYVPPSSTHEEQSQEADRADLELALKRARIPATEATNILAAHQTNRLALDTFRAAQASWEHTAWMEELPGMETQRPERPPIPLLRPVSGLPEEFAAYFAGFVAWHLPQRDLAAARAAWEGILALPAGERKFKSTWAAFMLGRSWEAESPTQAIEYFQRTRKLARDGFADSLGLATAALGREARVELDQQHYARAMQLYLEQLAAGDPSAVQSLRQTAARALEGPTDELPALATNAATRLVLTAYLISAPGSSESDAETSAPHHPTQAWLEAVEAIQLHEVEAAERLALAAYQSGQFALAQRWISRAPHSVTALWLQAKLHLRAGKTRAAAALLAQATRALPVLAASETEPAIDFADHIYSGADSGELRPTREQMLGELGVLALTRGDFEQALDALVRAGFWPDAAYVAERVLTTDELKAYVDREWPNATIPRVENFRSETETESQEELALAPTTRSYAEALRHLLARRLTRESRGAEAMTYFPPEWFRPLAALTAALDSGWNESLDAATRARALFTAAMITRTNGMELLGTELAPDWFIYGGSYDWGLTPQNRATASAEAKLNVSSAPEAARAARHGTDPNQRFHYRYQAALLAWEAAKLLPNNSDETARILCTAGTWLKVRDPETADQFYKALVRRCRQTAIGAQADVMRWFPVLDEHGQPKPYVPKAAEPETGTELEEAEPTLPSDEAPLATPVEDTNEYYVIHSGDTLAKIAAAASALGREITVADLRAANPGLDGTRLRVGQRIVLP